MRPTLEVLALTLALGGCGGLSYYDPGEDGVVGPGGGNTPGGAPAGDDDDDATSGVPLRIDDVQPTFGSNGGGVEVEITGQFDDETQLWIDGKEARILELESDRALVEVPPSNAEGWVDVTATSGSRDAALGDGFQYWADGRGLSGMVGEAAYVDIVGDYWLDPTDWNYASIAFTRPADHDPMAEYATSLGSCQFEYSSGYVPVFYDPGANYLELSGGGSTARLDPQGNGVFQKGPDAGIVANQVYDLTAVGGDADWPVDSVNNLVEIPRSFNVTTPNLDRANPPNTSRAISLAWSGSGGDYVTIYLLRQRPSGQNWIDDGYVTCAVPDTGSFTVPANTWPDWSSGDLIHIQVGRAIERHVELDYNGSEAGLVGLFVVYGAALAN
ncbi:MAG: IPT/TIG domain-containing protein [Myxococcota bacterium]